MPRKATRSSFATMAAIVWTLVAALLVGLASPALAATEPPDTQCGSVLLYDLDTGEVLLEREGTTLRGMASLTKIMTCVLALENLDMSTEVTVTSDMVFPVGNNIGLQEGEVLTVEQLVNCLMVYSANDAAHALAVTMAGSEDAFADMMNQKAAELGMTSTNYLCCDGYSNEEAHHTTCEDLATLVNYALTIDGFTDLTNQASYTLAATNLHEERTFESTNYLMYDSDEVSLTVNGEARSSYYEGVFGIKTGFMLYSGRCLVAACDRNGTRLCAVVLLSQNEEDRWEDAIAMFDWGYENYQTGYAIEPGAVVGQVKVRGSGNVYEDVVCPDGVFITLDTQAGDSADTRCTITLDEGLEAPLAKGDKVGTVTYTSLDGTTHECDVVMANDVEHGGFWTDDYISDEEFYAMAKHWAIVGGCALLGLIIVIALISHATRKRRQKKAGYYGGHPTLYTGMVTTGQTGHRYQTPKQAKKAQKKAAKERAKAQKAAQKQGEKDRKVAAKQAKKAAKAGATKAAATTQTTKAASHKAHTATPRSDAPKKAKHAKKS